MSLLATLISQTSSLTVAAFDAASAGSWVPTKAAENKKQFTGHPAEILRGLGTGEELARFDVGPAAAVAFELEGQSGQVEVHRVSDEVLALVAPPRAWWGDADVDALFADALRADAVDDGDELGELEIESGSLALVYMWLDSVAAARELVGQGAASFAGGAGAVIEVGAGTHALVKRELAAEHGRELRVLYVVRR